MAERTPQARSSGWVAGGHRALALVLYAVRELRRNPRFTAVAVIGLAVGLGVGTAAFSALYALLWRPSPFPDSGRLYLLYEHRLAEGESELLLSPPILEEWRKRGRCFEEVAGVAVSVLTLVVDDQPEMVKAGMVTDGFFPALGVGALLGKLPVAGGETGGTEAGAVISARLWEQRFGGDPGIVGRPLQLGESVLPIEAVAPPEVETPGGTQIWVPLSMVGALFPTFPGILDDDEARLLVTYGRRSASCSEEAMGADLNRVATLLATDLPDSHSGVTASAIPLRARAARGMRRSLLVLQAGAVVLLLVLCANLANLLLARGAGRRRELAVRAALGGSPRRLIYELLAESLLVAGAAGLLGLGIAYGTIRILVALAPPQLPYTAHMGLQWPVVAVAIAAALATGALAGILPAVRAGSSDPQAALGAETGWYHGRPFSGLGQGGLVILQTALTAGLLLVGGMLARSYQGLQRVDPGFSPAGVLAVSLSLPGDRYRAHDRLVHFYDEVLGAIGRLPGVTAASAASDLPLQGSSCSVRVVDALDAQPVVGDVECQAVAPGYERTLGIPLLRGRGFTVADMGEPVMSALVNAKLAQRLWPGEDPLGRHLTIAGGRRLRGEEQRVEVVGVLGDVRQHELDHEPQPLLYLPELWHNMTILARVAGDPAELAAAARAAVWSVDSRQPISRVTTLDEVLAAATARSRFNAALVGASGLLCLLVAALGLYGVVAHYASHRRRELGIRLALGATRRRVVRSLVARSLALGTAGCALGLGAGLLAGLLLESMLYEIEPQDPAILVVVGLLVLGVTWATSYVPARRAAAIDPVTSLRGERPARGGWA